MQVWCFACYLHKDSLSTIQTCTFNFAWVESASSLISCLNFTPVRSLISNSVHLAQAPSWLSYDPALSYDFWFMFIYICLKSAILYPWVGLWVLNSKICICFKHWKFNLTFFWDKWSQIERCSVCWNLTWIYLLEAPDTTRLSSLPRPGAECTGCLI